MIRFAITIVCFLSFNLLFGQAPEKMSYQAVIRDGSGQLLANSQVGMQISILESSVNGNAVYVETQSPQTNANGLVSIEIGAGTVVQGSFSAIDWGNGPFFIKTETDPNGGSNYLISGTNQLISVPYALYAENSGNAGDKVQMLEIHYSANSTSTNWIGGLGRIKFNKDDYGPVDSITFVAYPRVGDSTNQAIVELMNITDNVPIAGSTLSSNQTSFREENGFLETGDLYGNLPNYRIALGVRMRSQTGGMFAATGQCFIVIYRD